MERNYLLCLLLCGALTAACGAEKAPLGAATEPVASSADDTDGGVGEDEGDDEVPSEPVGEPTLRSDVQPVTDAADALPYVFVPPFLDCREPVAGDTTDAPDGKVCTQVSIAGCTEEGKYFPDYASCEVVRTQRPFYETDPAAVPRTDDVRLQDPAFMAQLAWVTEQAEASACTCCHDSKIDGKAAAWDISIGPIWTDTISDTGLALFTGLADSSTLGAYAPEDNHGFNRDITGLPSTDSARMRAFFTQEATRRGITESDMRNVKPFGGPIYSNKTYKPGLCTEKDGIDAKGRIRWNGGAARYFYVVETSAANPGVPPNMDLPEGTIWRLDVMPDSPALEAGFRYGETPAGSFQAFPEQGKAPALEAGKTYRLFVYYDVGLRGVGCDFVYQN